MNSAVPLQRRFTPVPLAYLKDDIPLDELWPSLSRSTRKAWPTLLEQYRVVILADAGAGKTYELKAKAEELVASGRASFFLRLEDIDDSFGTSFEIGSPIAFDQWLAGNDEAWFFLDSVDEIRLAEPRAFERAVEAFAARLQGALQRAHIYISSRPYAWRPTLDQSLINEVLPYIMSRTEAVGNTDEDEDESAVESVFDQEVDEDEPSEPSPQVYLLAPLEDADIGTFARHRSVADVDAFREALERGSLLALARSPFDLQDLITAWVTDGSLGSRLSVLQGSVRRLLAQAAETSAGGFDEVEAMAAVQRLAVIATFTGLSNIRMPGKGGASALDASQVLDLGDEAVAGVLGSGVFGDPIFSEVRFRHREVRELLSAEWATSQLARQGGWEEIRPHLFKTSYGVDITPPRTRPLMPWLILFDALIRDRILATHPEIAIEGGDAASLPPDVRQGLLTTLIARVVEPTSDLRGLDNSEIAKIAQRDLEPSVKALIERYHDNDEALFVLGRLVWQGELAGCVSLMSTVAADPQRGLYARLVAIRAVATVGAVDDLHQLWRSFNDGHEPLPRRLLAEFAEYAPVDDVTVPLLLISIGRLEPRKQFEVSGLTQALNQFIERAALAVPPQHALLFELTKSLGEFLAREPHVERFECSVSETYQWLMSPALNGVEHLILARFPAAFDEACLAILAALPALRFWRGDDIDDRKTKIYEIVPAWPELNDALFWYTAHQYRMSKRAEDGRLVDDWPITFLGHFWSFDAASFARTLGWVRSKESADDRQLALARSFTTFVEAGRPADWLGELRAAVAGDAVLSEALALKLDPPPSQEGERIRRMDRKYKRDSKKRKEEEEKDRALFVADLRADPSKVRNPPGVGRGKLSTIHYNLLRMIEGSGMRRSRAEGANWSALIPEFGEEVATAYRDAAIAFWRTFKPDLRSEGADTSGIPYALIFAMAGLDIEFAGDGAIAALTKAQARRALRYVPWELNGFPRWFEAFFRQWRALSLDFLWSEILWELANTPAEGSFSHILSDIIYHGPWLQEEVAPRLFAWLSTHHAPSVGALSYMRTIILKGQGATAAQIAALARGKINDPTTPADQRPTWYALWVDSEPAPAIRALDILSASSALDDRRSFAKTFVVSLLGGRSDHSPTHMLGLFRTPSHLKDLYLMMHREIPAGDDIERAGKGVYSPTLQDDAQDARERLFALLDRIPGALSYHAIRDLAASHPVPRYREYMHVAAYRHAVNDGDLAGWEAAAAATFTRKLEALPRAD